MKQIQDEEDSSEEKTDYDVSSEQVSVCEMKKDLKIEGYLTPKPIFSIHKVKRRRVKRKTPTEELHTNNESET